MKQKILIYLCMNAIFSKTMQDTETVKFNSLFLHSFRKNCIHTKINQDFLLHIQNQKFKGLPCTVEILQKTVKLRN